MRCEQAAEFISALFDGEKVPAEAARHIGVCDLCRVRLNDYAQMSAELKRLANAAPATAPVPAPAFAGNREFKSNWWQFGRETMRIPRVAVALMVLAIVGLSTGLVLVRANNFGALSGSGTLWFEFGARYPEGGTFLDSQALPALSGKGHAGYFGLKDGQLAFVARLIALKDQSAEIGIRAEKFGPHIDRSTAVKEVRKCPERVNWYPLGKRVMLAATPGLQLSGKLLAHMPEPGQPRETPVAVTIDEAKRVYVAGTEVTLSTLAKEIVSKAPDPWEFSVSVRCDPRVPYGVLETVIEALQQAQISNFSLVTRT